MSISSTDLHGEAERRLAAVAARYTPKRRALVEVFAEAGQPMTLPEVIAANSSLAQSSVYRNLLTLEEAGVVNRIVTNGDRARYELSEAISGVHHHHLICAECGSVEDFTLPSTVESRIATEFAEVAGRRSFTPRSHQLDLIGHCAACREDDLAD